MDRGCAAAWRWVITAPGSNQRGGEALRQRWCWCLCWRRAALDCGGDVGCLKQSHCWQDRPLGVGQVLAMRWATGKPVLTAGQRLVYRAHTHTLSLGAAQRKNFGVLALGLAEVLGGRRGVLGGCWSRGECLWRRWAGVGQALVSRGVSIQALGRCWPRGECLSRRCECFTGSVQYTYFASRPSPD